MKARKNPTNEQILRRLRRPPESCQDARVKNDPYWALRFQGYPHSYAVRAFREEPPAHNELIVPDDAPCDDFEPEELFFPPGSTVIETKIAIRPELSETAIRELAPRDKEYTAWDQEIRGLGVRVRASGYKSYVLFLRIGHPRKLHKWTIGPTSDYSLKEARSLAKSFRRKARRGDDPENE